MIGYTGVIVAPIIATPKLHSGGDILTPILYTQPLFSQ
jgi:hypothetical protein